MAWQLPQPTQPQPPQPPRRAASLGGPGWQGWLLVVVAVLSCAALGLGTFAVVDGRDYDNDDGGSRIDGQELLEDLAAELESRSEEEPGLFDYEPTPDFDMEGGVGGVSPIECLGTGEAATGPGLGPQPRSPDELDPVLEAGQEAVVSFRPLECDQPVVFRIRVDQVSVLDTAPTAEYPPTPSHGKYVVVEATIEMLNDSLWPDWFAFTLVGPDYTVVTPLYSDSVFTQDALYPGDSASATLVFDAPDGYDLIVFDDYTPGSVSWRY